MLTDDHAKMTDACEIVNLNVGGRKFATTKFTLLSINDTFFTVLLSGRIPSYKDDSGAIFIDRDPELFSIILNYLRTSQLFNVTENNVDVLKHEAEFYGIAPLVHKLNLYNNLVTNPNCGGDILFQVWFLVLIIVYVFVNLHFSYSHFSKWANQAKLKSWAR